MQWIIRAWRGEEKLWKVIWIYGVLGTILLFVGIFAAALILSRLGQANADERFVTYLFWLWWPLEIYIYWVAFSLFSSTRNKKNGWRGHAAKIFSLFIIIPLGYQTPALLRDSTKAGFYASFECGISNGENAKREKTTFDDYEKTHSSEEKTCKCQKFAEFLAIKQSISASAVIKQHQAEYDKCIAP